MSAIFETHEEFREYNKVVVTLITKNKDGDLKTVISNANKKGISLFKDDAVSNANLVSLTVEPPAFDSGDPSNCGAKGTITLVDYKDHIFNVLTNHFVNFLSSAAGVSEGSDLTHASVPQTQTIENSKLLPGVIIEISCYIGPTKTYIGHILDWSTQFVGTTPNIQLNWSVILPSDINPEKPYEAPTLSTDALKYYQDVRARCDSNNQANPKKIIVNGLPGENNLSLLQIPVDVVQPVPNSCGNKIVDALQLLCSVATIDGKPIAGYLSDDCETYTIVIKDPYSNTLTNETKSISNSVIYIQNGKYPAYSHYNGKLVIPMTSFSFDTSFNKLALQYSITTNPNGNKLVVNGNPSTDANVGNGGDTSGTQTQTQLQSQAKDAGEGAITIKFDCYNTMAFDQYNLSSEINFIVFNEHGKKHATSGKAIVTKVSYDLQGAVVKASVDATQVFNSIVGQTVSGSGKSIGEMQFALPPKPVAPGNGSNPSNPGTKSGNPTKPSKNPELVAYLRTEDEDPIPLNVDKTADLIINGTFRKHVDEFLNLYGDFTGTQKLLDGNFVQKLIEAGNFGLLTLIIGAGNYGIKNYSDEDWSKIKVDPVNLYKGLNTKFCASDGGKNPYDYKTGGLGMPHWDSDNLKEIYTRHGFDPNISDSDKKHFESLLIAEHPKKPEEYNGTISDWKIGKTALDQSITRCFPVFSGKVYMRRFDKGLKQDAKWLEWARKLLYYRGENDNNRVYQYNLFEMWITKFWNPTMSRLKTTSAESGHTICLQDAIRISRAGSSATGLIKEMVGKNVSHQYDIYYGGEDRYDRQKAFCRRLCDIVGYELSD